MDFTIDKQELSAAIDKCALAVPDGAKHPTPAFQVMLVDANKSKTVRFAAVGEFCSVDTVGEAAVKTKGSFVVTPKRLSDIVSAMPPGKIQFTLKGTRVTAKSLTSSRKASFESSTIEVRPVEDPGEGAPWKEVDSRELVRGLALAKQAYTWEDRSDPIIALLLPTERGLDIFGCNMQRIALIETKIQIDGDPIQLPATAIVVLNLMATEDDFVKIFSDKRRVYLESKNTLVSAPLPAEYAFASTHKMLIDAVKDETAAVGPVFKVKPFIESIKALQRLGGFASGEERSKGFPIDMLFGDFVKVKCSVSEAGADDEIPVESTGAQLDARVWNRHIEQTLSSLADADVVQVAQIASTLIFRTQGLTVGVSQLMIQ